MLRSLPPETFEAYKAAAAKKLKEKQKSIAEKGRKFNVECFDYDGDFERDAKALEALEALTQEEVAAMLERSLVEESRQLLPFWVFHAITRPNARCLCRGRHWRPGRRSGSTSRRNSPN